MTQRARANAPNGVGMGDDEHRLAGDDPRHDPLLPQWLWGDSSAVDGTVKERGRRRQWGLAGLDARGGSLVQAGQRRRRRRTCTRSEQSLRLSASGMTAFFSRVLTGAWPGAISMLMGWIYINKTNICPSPAVLGVHGLMDVSQRVPFQACGGRTWVKCPRDRGQIRG